MNHPVQGPLVQVPLLRGTAPDGHLKWVSGARHPRRVPCKEGFCTGCYLRNLVIVLKAGSQKAILKTNRGLGR